MSKRQYFIADGYARVAMLIASAGTRLRT